MPLGNRHVIAAKVVALAEARTTAFRGYAQVVDNAERRLVHLREIFVPPDAHGPVVRGLGA